MLGSEPGHSPLLGGPHPGLRSWRGISSVTVPHPPPHPLAPHPFISLIKQSNLDHVGGAGGHQRVLAPLDLSLTLTKPTIPSPEELPAAGSRRLLSPSLDSVRHTETRGGAGPERPPLAAQSPPLLGPQAGPGLDLWAQTKA